MEVRDAAGNRRYRVWIVVTKDWRPEGWRDVPRCAKVVEAATAASLSAEDAALFVEGFNRQMLVEERGLWAVIVPVHLLYEGDLRPGQILRSDRLLSSPISTD